MCPECHHIMPTGAKCHSPALRGKPYCYFHIRLHTLTRKPGPSPEEPINFSDLADRGNIQTALGQVLDALSSSRLAPRHAGLLLYGLQIASHNCERGPEARAGSAAHIETPKSCPDTKRIPETPSTNSAHPAPLRQRQAGRSRLPAAESQARSFAAGSS